MSLRLIPISEPIGRVQKPKKTSFKKEEALLRESGYPTRQGYQPESGVDFDEYAPQAKVQLQVSGNAERAEVLERRSGMAPENLESVLKGSGPEDELNSYIEKMNDPRYAEKKQEENNKKLKNQILAAVAKRLGIFSSVDTDSASIKANEIDRDYGFTTIDRNVERPGYIPGAENAGNKVISSDVTSSEGKKDYDRPPNYPPPGYNTPSPPTLPPPPTLPSGNKAETPDSSKKNENYSPHGYTPSEVGASEPYRQVGYSEVVAKFLSNAWNAFSRTPSREERDARGGWDFEYWG